MELFCIQQSLLLKLQERHHKGRETSRENGLEMKFVPFPFDERRMGEEKVCDIECILI